MKYIMPVMGIALLLLFTCPTHAQQSLTIATDDWPPYEFMDGTPGNDFVSGFSTEVLMAVFKRMNVTVKDRINMYPWARGEKLLINGDIDVLYTGATNEERAKITHYPSEPLVETSWVFFIRKADDGAFKFESFDDLKGKRIGVVRAYAYTPEFWAFLEKEKNYDEVTHDEQNLNKLMLKRIDYVIVERGNGLYLAKKMGILDQISILEKPVQTVSLFPIFSKQTLEKDFVDKFSEELKLFKTTEEYQAIYKKYLEVSN